MSGARGAPGTPGRFVESVLTRATGDIEVNFSDAVAIDLGQAKGIIGPRGSAPGDPAFLKSLLLTDNDRLLATLTDGTKVDLGTVHKLLTDALGKIQDGQQYPPPPDPADVAASDGADPGLGDFWVNLGNDAQDSGPFQEAVTDAFGNTTIRTDTTAQKAAASGKSAGGNTHITVRIPISALGGSAGGGGVGSSGGGGIGAPADGDGTGSNQSGGVSVTILFIQDGVAGLKFDDGSKVTLGKVATAPDGSTMLTGGTGPRGLPGLSAYQVWLAAGHTGTEADFLAFCQQGPKGDVGPSAYQVWLAAGHTGTQAEFLASLQSTAPGPKGDAGPSAYQVWLAAGHTGTEADFLTFCQQGPAGGKGDPGTPGLSAYQVWLAAGHTGTVADFLASLVSTAPGPKGDPGGAAEAVAVALANVPGLTATNVQDAISQLQGMLPRGGTGPAVITASNFFYPTSGPAGETFTVKVTSTYSPGMVSTYSIGGLEAFSDLEAFVEAFNQVVPTGDTVSYNSPVIFALAQYGYQFILKASDPSLTIDITANSSAVTDWLGLMAPDFTPAIGPIPFKVAGYEVLVDSMRLSLDDAIAQLLNSTSATTIQSLAAGILPDYSAAPDGAVLKVVVDQNGFRSLAFAAA